MHLTEDSQQPQPPLFARILKPDDRIVEFLFGSDEIDARLRATARSVIPRCGFDALLLDAGSRGAFRNAWPSKADAEAVPDRDTSVPVVILQGSPGAGKASIAEAICHEGVNELLIVDVSAVQPDASRVGSPAPRNGLKWRA